MNDRGKSISSHFIPICVVDASQGADSRDTNVFVTSRGRDWTGEEYTPFVSSFPTNTVLVDFESSATRSRTWSAAKTGPTDGRYGPEVGVTTRRHAALVAANLGRVDVEGDARKSFESLVTFENETNEFSIQTWG